MPKNSEPVVRLASGAESTAPEHIFPSQPRFSAVAACVGKGDLPPLTGEALSVCITATERGPAALQSAGCVSTPLRCILVSLIEDKAG